MNEPELTITKLRRCDGGWWTARATIDGVTVEVDCRYGSWQAEVRAAPRVQQHVRKDLDPSVARRLQEKVRPLERQERAAIAVARKREEARRLAEFRELKPSEKDLARRQLEIADELDEETRGVTLARLLTEERFAWAQETQD